jgi:DNA polymerase-3 subunit alpha
VLGITALDPLEYDLIFERFLNPGRISMPDIDTDFEDTYRDKVIEYITQRYGKDNVAHIGTYMSLAAKAAFKDVARVMGIKFDQANKLTSLVTEKTVALSVEKNKDLQDAIKADTRLQKVIEVATAIE